MIRVKQTLVIDMRLGHQNNVLGRITLGGWSRPPLGWSMINVDGSFLVVDDDFVNVLDSQKCHISVTYERR